jgi:hypothetical protein
MEEAAQMPRPRSTPVRNPALAASIAETGQTYGSIAETINRVAREDGAVICCTAASLAKWLNGATPQPATMPAAVEAFARLLDQPCLAAADLGWHGYAIKATGDPWRGDPVAWITHLGRDDMLNRRTAMTAGLYSLAAATLPARPHLTTSRAGPARQAGPSDVARIRRTGEVFNEIDDLYGGGHARAAVAAYLTQEVTPLLRGTTGKARPELFLAAAEATYLVGWMAADDMKTGLAQRYYVQAVRLAEEADDPLMRSTVLRSLSVQAIELGHAQEGLALAEAAADGLRSGCPARKRAWITGMCAEALAATGSDLWRSRGLLRKAEAELERADSLPEHEWTGNYRRESFEHQVGLTLTQAGDLKGAEEHFAASVGSRRTIERRTRALIGARLAHVQLRRRRPDQAARTLLDLSGDLGAVSSQRLRRVLTDIRSGWQPFRADPAVSKADHLVAGMLQMAPVT